MVDIQALRNAVANFAFYAKSSNSGSSSAPVTMSDLNKVIAETAKVLNIFVDELEKRG